MNFTLAWTNISILIVCFELFQRQHNEEGERRKIFDLFHYVLFFIMFSPDSRAGNSLACATWKMTSRVKSQVARSECSVSCILSLSTTNSLTMTLFRVGSCWEPIDGVLVSSATRIKLNIIFFFSREFQNSRNKSRSNDVDRAASYILPLEHAVSVVDMNNWFSISINLSYFICLLTHSILLLFSLFNLLTVVYAVVSC